VWSIHNISFDSLKPDRSPSAPPTTARLHKSVDKIVAELVWCTVMSFAILGIGESKRLGDRRGPVTGCVNHRKH
jgi:hypothetical protein